MSDPNIAISVHSLTKKYPLYDSPRDRLKEALHPARKKYHRDFFALRDVSFQINKGDSLGIIGQNGSGKSTLLKILSKVLTPSSGSFKVSGRVISLLELGSGFNPELTGLENVFFYGTILGFSQKEIESKIDEILTFADIGQFINQPLKVYSSGMSARLAFAVASHVDPDILILDEVLAVGDIRFKQKCYRVMHNIIDQNRTVLLASHSTNSVNDFCNNTLWLDHGKVTGFGPSRDITKRYIAFMAYGIDPESDETSGGAHTSGEKNRSKIEGVQTTKNIRWFDVEKCESFGEKGGLIEKVAICHKDNYQKIDSLKGGEWISIFTKIKTHRNIHQPGLGIRIKDNRGNGIFTINNYLYNKPLREFTSGEEVIIRTDFRFPLLKVGKYSITIALSDGNQTEHIQHHWVHDAIIVSVDNHDPKFKRSNVLVISDDCYNIELDSNNKNKM